MTLFGHCPGKVTESEKVALGNHRITSYLTNIIFKKRDKIERGNEEFIFNTALE